MPLFFVWLVEWQQEWIGHSFCRYIRARTVTRDDLCVSLQMKELGEYAFHDLVVIAPAMGLQAIGAILNAIVGIDKIAAAFIAQAIQRAIAEQTAEFLLVHSLMVREKFAFLILEKIVMGHIGYLPKN